MELPASGYAGPGQLCGVAQHEKFVELSRVRLALRSVLQLLHLHSGLGNILLALRLLLLPALSRLVLLPALLLLQLAVLQQWWWWRSGGRYTWAKEHRAGAGNCRHGQWSRQGRSS